MKRRDLSKAACLLFQIRAYTDKNKFSENAWSQPISTAIIVGITVTSILLVLVILSFASRLVRNSVLVVRILRGMTQVLDKNL